MYSSLFMVMLATSGLAAPLTSLNPAKRVTDPASAQVTNSDAFSDPRGGGQNSVNDNDGNGAGTDSYTYYSGGKENFPDNTKWVNFEDMFTANEVYMRESCANNGWGANDSDDEIADIMSGIEAVAAASLVDHRFILAVIMQESVGCVRVPTTDNGVSNPGLMQSHDGSTYDPNNPASSIQQMISDGTQGTTAGDGLVQGLNSYGDVYEAARVYNSGSISSDGNLSNGNGATPCYVSDIANRLTGWVQAASGCTN
ncbi:MAG: hypothetical protein M1818_004374 [Claussenomyces sp. TS43310]|nr:MAG: hypothetical protein M1818_004374 [Claussenomyces sp. TS43310]